LAPNGSLTASPRITARRQAISKEFTETSKGIERRN